MTNEYEQNESLYDRDKAHESARALFRDGGRALQNADLDKPVKMFGLFEVDAGLAAYATMGYNVGSDYLSRAVAPRTYELTKKYAAPHMSQSGALKAAALATTAMNVVLKSGGYFTPMITSIQESREERSKLARRIAPILDEEVGKHSAGALKAVAKENTVLKAHMVRMSKQHGVRTMNNFVDLLVNAGPNLALNFNEAKGMWNGKSPKEIRKELAQQKLTTAANEAIAEPSAGNELREMGKLFMQGGTGAFTDRFKKSNLHKLNKTLRPYSSLEMILTLDEQFKGNPKSRSYQVPGKRGESYPLEEYIARIAIHNSMEMADISTEHSEIREALHDELAKSVKPIAEALRKGDLEPIELVRILGEGKLVQKGGRVIASPEDVHEMIGDKSAQGVNRHQTVEEHYANAAYSREEFKKALHALDGDEQRIFASLFSDAVLEDAGIKPTKIKEWRETTAARRDADQHLAEGALGAAGDGHSAAQEGVASKKELAMLKSGAHKIEQHGVQAVHDLRSSATNPHGIEQAVANVAVAKVLGNKSSYVEMLNKGRALLAANENHGNDNEHSFAAREARRAQAGHGEMEV